MKSVATLDQNAEGASFNATSTNITIANDATYGDCAYWLGDGTTKIEMDTIPTSALVGNANRTISFWVNFDAITGNQNVYSQGNLASGEGNFQQVKIGSGLTDVRVEFGNNGSNQKYVTTLASNTWYFFSVTYDGTASRTYWQGSLVLTHTINLNLEAGFVNLGNAFSNGADFKGKMLDFRIYDTPLDAVEITDLYSLGPSGLVSVNPTMYSYVADVSWSSLFGATSYTLTVAENSGTEFIVEDSIGETETLVYNLNDNSSYDFRVYTDLNPSEVVGESLSNATPVIDSTALTNMITEIPNDLTLFNSATVSEIQPFMGSSFSTNDAFKNRVVFNDSYLTEDTKFVKDGETITLGESGSILTPFVPSGSAGQSVNLELSTSTVETVAFDEVNNTITVEGTTYSPGDRFILDGKSCKVGELN